MKLKKLLSSLVSFSLIFNPFLFASDITPDSSSPNNTPSIQTAPNELIPIVNIVNPNKDGLSHNKFKDYNVDKNGIIL
ncbi:MAG: filamentous hemagglutinin N-terminal domain-containing protein, partial [Campylobacteraceae bacterium]|nr:filamentous hemagglutinin N-terminal domain-containing protein [Campylobacteraceae bacterium]